MSPIQLHDLHFSEHQINGKILSNLISIIYQTILYLSTKPLACMMFERFIVSLIMYCLQVLYPAMYQRDKKDILNIFKDATQLGLELGYDLDPIVNNHTKSRIMQIYMDDEHFMQELLKHCPSGRLRHSKYRTPLGKDCFSYHMCIYINKTVF